jgi:hypothetical protein
VRSRPEERGGDSPLILPGRVSKEVRRAAPAAGRHAGLGRPGAPPGGHYGPPARSWLIRMASSRSGKRGPGSEKSRSRAPRGAPARVMGRSSSGVPGDGSARETDHGVRRFRTSACRRPAPLNVFGERKRTRASGALIKPAAERWLDGNRMGIGEGNSDGRNPHSAVIPAKRPKAARAGTHLSFRACGPMDSGSRFARPG